MKQELIEALKQLGRGRIDAAEAIAELLMPEPVTFSVPLAALPVTIVTADNAAEVLGKKKAK
jgi:hypothetical protein